MSQSEPPVKTSETPVVCTAGVDGMLVRFSDTLGEAANRAALAFKAAVEVARWDGVEETSSSLVSVYVRFDPIHLDHTTLHRQIKTLLGSCDWYAAQLPEGRRLWRIPAVFGTDLAPQLSEVAAQAGLSVDDAIASLTSTRLRVQTIGFAPGQPYLGTLPDAWDIPRQSQLTARVPEGAISVAIRQLVLFSVSTPTGWQHVGQTAMRLFQPDAEEPFLLRAGDEVLFKATTPEQLNAFHRDPMGGAKVSVIG
ncbi:allophanate hydrolase subunit 1 [Aliiroseovarius sp. F47248L]|uniref:5-oxoprolinase subunit B family protein n=1 Tax=Aliiroseovarius sp. F47248L TaxID=2926420 RepID=UPI0032B2DA15